MAMRFNKLLARHFKMMEQHDPNYRASVEAMFANREGIKVFAPSDIDTAGYLVSVGITTQSRKNQ